MKLLKLILLASGLCLGLGIQSCKKKKDPDTTITTPANPTNGTLMLHLHTNADSNEVDSYNEVYLVPNHRKISLNLAQMYITGIQLIKTDGSTYDVPNTTILKVLDIEEYLVGTVPAGNYKSIRFNVGLPAATNTATPASSDTTLNRPDMWFGSTAQPDGFVFMNFQGKIDTSTYSNNTEAQMQPFKYRIGMPGHLTSITMPDQNYSIVPGQVQFVHITIDYNKLFAGIVLNNAANLTVNSAYDNTSVLGAQIAGNITLMFRYEE